MRCHASVYLTVRDALLNTKIRMKYERQQYRAIAIPQKKKKNEMKMKNVTLHMQSRLPIRQNDLLFSIYEFFILFSIAERCERAICITIFIKTFTSCKRNFRSSVNISTSEPSPCIRAFDSPDATANKEKLFMNVWQARGMATKMNGRRTSGNWCMTFSRIFSKVSAYNMRHDRRPNLAPAHPQHCVAPILTCISFNCSSASTVPWQRKPDKVLPNP